MMSALLPHARMAARRLAPNVVCFPALPDPNMTVFWPRVAARSGHLGVPGLCCRASLP